MKQHTIWLSTRLSPCRRHAACRRYHRLRCGGRAWRDTPGDGTGGGPTGGRVMERKDDGGGAEDGVGERMDRGIKEE
ncbi:hypothetical protein NHX12_026896 [Muraenolepis orangiensis]|uniref:Uncharacterized protein n=1 Tax=Muraenolepis orangiensis TaxID=630683 RepID=A0A9Q0EE09_9TELE|nr:hypothetical protein NHX12_026896 [Muraenolepis orangiensis]